MALTSLVVMPMRGSPCVASGLLAARGLSCVVRESLVARGADGVFGSCTSVRTQTFDSDSDGQGKFRYSVAFFPAHLKMVSAEASGATNNIDKRTHMDFDTIESPRFL